MMIEGDIRDKQTLNKIFDEHQISSVIHFAGLKAVGESVEKPLEYYQNNVEGSLCLFDVMNDHDVKSIVFSSSATVWVTALSSVSSSWSSITYGGIT